MEKTKKYDVVPDNYFQLFRADYAGHVSAYAAHIIKRAQNDVLCRRAVYRNVSHLRNGTDSWTSLCRERPSCRSCVTDIVAKR